METMNVSAQEYAGLLHLERVLRMAMTVPGTGEFIAVALQALDAVRRVEGLPGPEKVNIPQAENAAGSVSAMAAAMLAQAVIGKARES